MARVAFGCTLGAGLGPTGEGRFNTLSGSVAPALTSTTTADTDAGTASTAATTADNDAGTAAGTLTTNVAAAVAVLVADGASPTQAHVNTLNTAWGLLATAIATAKTSTAAAKTAAATAKTSTAAAKVAAAGANVVLDIDTAVVTTRNGVNAAVRNLLRTIEGSGLPP